MPFQVAGGLTANQKRRLDDVFDQMDKDGGGELDVEVGSLLLGGGAWGQLLNLFRP